MACRHRVRRCARTAGSSTFASSNAYRSAGVGPLRIGGIRSGEREPRVEAVVELGAQGLWWVGAHPGAVGPVDVHGPVRAERFSPARDVHDLVVEAAAGPEVPGLGGPCRERQMTWWSCSHVGDGTVGIGTEAQLLALLGLGRLGLV